MVGELRIVASSGLTVKALIVSTAGTVWDGSALVAVSTLTDAEWTSSLIACTEQTTSDGTGSGLYLADWPGTLTESAVYSAAFYEGSAPVPNDEAIGTQSDPTEYESVLGAAILEDTGTTLPAAIADVPTVAEFEARTILAAAYFDPSADEVTTDAASRTASKATSVTVSDKTGFVLDATGLNAVMVDGKTVPEALQIMAAGLLGKVTGAGTGTEVFVGLDGNTTRATVTVDGSGNRTGVVYV